jgi:outer membrane protein assembly factor BamB
MHQDPTSPSDEVALNRCQDLPPVPVLTTVAPVGAQETLYVPTYDQLYAVNASDGTVRWCQQVTLTREYRYQSGVSLSSASTYALRNSASGQWRRLRLCF